MLRTMTLADAIHVATRMRAMDRACVSAVLGDIEDEAFAVSRWQTTGPAWTLADATGKALAVFGLSLPNAWTAVAWLIAADGIASAAWRELIRHARAVASNVSTPGREAYRHRVEAHVLAGWGEARRFAQALGLGYEGTRCGAGRLGENVEIWAIVGPAKGA